MSIHIYKGWQLTPHKMLTGPPRVAANFIHDDRPALFADTVQEIKRAIDNQAEVQKGDGRVAQVR